MKLFALSVYGDEVAVTHNVRLVHVWSSYMLKRVLSGLYCWIEGRTWAFSSLSAIGCQYIVWVIGWGQYDEEVVAGDEAVATVACDLVAAGAFRTIAIAEGAGEVEKRCALHFEDCFKARTAFLAGVDRSILEDVGRVERREREV
jgi:hypothetical protein